LEIFNIVIPQIFNQVIIKVKTTILTTTSWLPLNCKHQNYVSAPYAKKGQTMAAKEGKP